MSDPVLTIEEQIKYLRALPTYVKGHEIWIDAILSILTQLRDSREAIENGASKLVHVAEYECQDEDTSTEYRRDAAILRALLAATGEAT